ncbi:hypothetical protein DSL92_08605 [Billgrantia gudaonensis]|uniref:Uncharacterized protein n=1 Tax=Billgrantia gudaonensis TaxID=376427 RepID=A0A432JHS2_9GAMM|nr:hypothetical protein DSL92_08605 [Halomonas gudaonensis]
MSHRSGVRSHCRKEQTEADRRIPDVIPGAVPAGAGRIQFAMLPMNLLGSGGFLHTGIWARRPSPRPSTLATGARGGGSRLTGDACAAPGGYRAFRGCRLYLHYMPPLRTIPKRKTRLRLRSSGALPWTRRQRRCRFGLPTCRRFFPASSTSAARRRDLRQRRRTSVRGLTLVITCARTISARRRRLHPLFDHRALADADHGQPPPTFAWYLAQASSLPMAPHDIGGLERRWRPSMPGRPGALFGHRRQQLPATTRSLLRSRSSMNVPSCWPTRLNEPSRRGRPRAGCLSGITPA